MGSRLMSALSRDFSSVDRKIEQDDAHHMVFNSVALDTSVKNTQGYTLGTHGIGMPLGTGLDEFGRIYARLQEGLQGPLMAIIPFIPL